MNKTEISRYISQRVNSTGHSAASIQQFEQSKAANLSVSEHYAGLDETVNQFIEIMRSQGMPEDQIIATLGEANMLPEQQLASTGYQYTPDGEVDQQVLAIEGFVQQQIELGYFSEEIAELLAKSHK